MMMTPRTPEQIPAMRGTLSMSVTSFWLGMVVDVVVVGGFVVFDVVVAAVGGGEFICNHSLVLRVSF